VRDPVLERPRHQANPQKCSARVRYTPFRGPPQEIVGARDPRSDSAWSDANGGGIASVIRCRLCLPGLLCDSPFDAWMQDQVEACARRVRPRAAFVAGMLKRVSAVLAALQSNGWILLYVSPERLAGWRPARSPRPTKLALFAIDEPTGLQWATTSAPDYLQLRRAAAASPPFRGTHRHRRPPTRARS